jgi:hypothetical protein
MAIAVVLTTNAVAEFNFSQVPAQLSTYYASPIQPLDSLKEKLTNSGFEIVGSTEVLSGETVLTLTNDELKATNSYMATLQLLVNTINNEIRVQNPSYLGAAYLQDNYKYGQFKSTLTALQSVLGSINEVDEKTDFDDLASYQFMFGMPRVKDTISVIKGNNLESKTSTPQVAYTLKLPNGSLLVGHTLSKRSRKFLGKIKQEHNAQLLPYEAIIQNNEVRILDPKYYLALSLPLLSMGDFMKIATTPDHILKDIQKVYQ